MGICCISGHKDAPGNVSNQDGCLATKLDTITQVDHSPNAHNSTISTLCNSNYSINEGRQVHQHLALTQQVPSYPKIRKIGIFVSISSTLVANAHPPYII